MTECSRCHVPKADDEFYSFKGKRHGNICKACKRSQHKKRYHTDPRPKIDSAWVGRIKKKYGITVEQYDALLEAQGGRCYICEKKPKGRRLAVDHDHRTGVVRGLLCSEDNYMLGWMHDNARRFARAGGYLDNPPAVAVLGYHRVPGAPPIRENG